ncbi:MAG: hypothetical protein IPP67_04705 [Rhodospirillaceae bacterium]|nr:hypothetical protein [Rhodospirillaceae bacterium]
MKISALTTVSLFAVFVSGCSETPEDKARREATKECTEFFNGIANPGEKEDKEMIQQAINECIEDATPKIMRELNQPSPN